MPRRPAVPFFFSVGFASSSFLISLVSVPVETSPDEEVGTECCTIVLLMASLYCLSASWVTAFRSFSCDEEW
jgi:hypothetical protein